MGFGIRTKLTAIFLLVSLLPVGFLGWQTFTEQKKVIQEEVARSHKELSNTLARGIYENLEYTRKLVGSIVELDMVKALNPVVTDDLFQALLRHFHFFKVMYLVDGHGKIIAGDPSTSLRSRWSFGDAIRRLYKSGSFSEVHPAPEGKGSVWMTL